MKRCPGKDLPVRTSLSGVGGTWNPGRCHGPGEGPRSLFQVTCEESKCRLGVNNLREIHGLCWFK